MSRLLLAVLLLGGGTAGGDQNETEAAPSVQKARSSAGGHIVVKEGSSMLIECNVTGGHDDFRWYNSKGPLLGEDRVGGENAALSSGTTLSFSITV